MHAASVYPEPGSNSLNMIYHGPFDPSYRVCLLFLLFRALFLIQKNFRSLFFSSLLFNFQGSSPALSGGQLCYYIKTFSPCQVLFSKFFKLFSLTASRFFLPSALADSLTIISSLSPFVNHFFQHFLPSLF